MIVRPRATFRGNHERLFDRRLAAFGQDLADNKGAWRAISALASADQLLRSYSAARSLSCGAISFHDRERTLFHVRQRTLVKWLRLAGVSDVANTPLSCRPRLLRKRNQNLAQLGGSRDVFGEVEPQGQII